MLTNRQVLTPHATSCLAKQPSRLHVSCPAQTQWQSLLWPTCCSTVQKPSFLLPWVSGQGATPQTHQKLISKDLGFSCHLYLGLALSCPCLNRIQYQLYRRSSVDTCSTGEAWGILLGWGPLEAIYFLIHQQSIQQLLCYCVKH